jgi:hypothetical protein
MFVRNFSQGRLSASFPLQQPQQSRHVRDSDSRLLRRTHWRPSQLETNDASDMKTEQLEFSFSFPKMDDASNCKRNERDDRNR